MPNKLVSLWRAIMDIAKVLVAIDESEDSERALNFALGLSDKFGSAVTILNVSEALPVAPNPADALSSSNTDKAAVAKDISNIHENFLTKSAEKAKASHPNLTISSMHKQGDPAIEIVHTAKEGAFGVIVIGHRGQGKMRVRDFLMGTISEKVAHLAPCPVIVVK